MSDKDGGPAFPNRAVGHVQESRGSADQNLNFQLVGGMALRDYFAAKALASFSRDHEKEQYHSDPGNTVTIAKKCYLMADAMLAERQK